MQMFSKIVFCNLSISLIWMLDFSREWNFLDIVYTNPEILKYVTIGHKIMYAKLLHPILAKGIF